MGNVTVNPNDLAAIEHNLADQPDFDPADFTTGDWAIMKDVLVKEAQWLQWKAAKPGQPPAQGAELAQAAERRFSLARQCVAARAWKVGLDAEEAAGLTVVE